jgi:hypothetical protein
MFESLAIEETGDVTSEGFIHESLLWVVYVNFLVGGCVKRLYFVYYPQQTG